MKCNRCKEEADLGINDEPLCYDCALTAEGDDAVAAAKFHSELYAAREENRQLRARVAGLEAEVASITKKVAAIVAHWRLMQSWLGL